MSKFSQKSIYIPHLAKAEIQKFTNGTIIWFASPNAAIFRYFFQTNTKILSPNTMLFEIKDQKFILNTTKISYAQTFYKLLKKQSNQKKSQYFNLLHNQLQKVFRSTIIGYKKYLLVRGVGYKFLKKKHYLSFQVGYSHKINVLIPSDCKLKLNRKATTIQLRNFNDAFLHGLISTIRNYKKPDVYKGKGLRYKRDTVIRKEGKKKKTF